jgi:hypothetical protein
MKQQYQRVASLIATGADRVANSEYGWFMSPKERGQMQNLQTVHRAVDPVEQTLESRISLNPMAIKLRTGEWMNVTEILKKCGVYPVGKREANVGARWLRAQGFEPDGSKRYCVTIVLPDQPYVYPVGKNYQKTGSDS